MGVRRFRPDHEVRALLNIDAKGVPISVSMRQARLAMAKEGLLAKVNKVASSADQETQIEWEYGTDVRRDSPLVAIIAVALRLKDSDVDDLFKLAATL